MSQISDSWTLLVIEAFILFIMSRSVGTVACQLCGSSEINGVEFAKCTRCDVDVCDTSQDQHSLANRSHTFTIQTTEHDDKYEGGTDVCLYYASHTIKYICHTHDVLCCSECKLRHRTCHKIETITKAAISHKLQYQENNPF